MHHFHMQPDLIKVQTLPLFGFRISTVRIIQKMEDITVTGMDLESQTAHTEKILHCLVEMVINL